MMLSTTTASLATPEGPAPACGAAIELVKGEAVGRQRPGTKLDRARDLGPPVLDEAQLKALLTGEGFPGIGE